MRIRYIILALFMAIFLIACVEDAENTAGDNVADDTTVEIETEKTSSTEKDDTDSSNKKSEDKEDHTAKEDVSQDKDLQELSELAVHYIDVGQADATLFQFADDEDTYTILYDAGDWNKNDVVNYLAAQDISSIDILIASHPHADHIGQLAAIVNTYDVDEIWASGNTSSTQTYQQAMEAILASDANYHEPRAGEVYDIGPMTIEILHPSSLTGGLNEDSLSAMFTYGDTKFLFTGDAYTEQERLMMKRTDNIEATVLQLGHHGSSTSSDTNFIEAVNPDIAIYSAGEGNSYGHPHDEIVTLFQQIDIPLYGTDVHGTIIVTTDGANFSIATKEDGTVSPKNTGASADKPSKPEKKEQENKKTTPIDDCVNINEATVDELQQIIHIGPARAEDIIELRPFKSVDDLTRINGIGPARIDDIKSEGQACVGG